MTPLTVGAPQADVTYRAIGAAMQVHNELGPGHREVVYHRALVLKLPQPPFNLSLTDEPRLPLYDPGGALIYSYCPDFVLEEAVILELKAQTHPLSNDDLAQVIDYFAASQYGVALLVNFGRPRLEWKRVFPPKKFEARRRQRAEPG